MMLVAEGLPDQITGANITGFLYLSVIGALFSYVIWFRGIERLPVLAASFLSFFSPLTATVLGYVFLGQALSPLQLAGALAVIFAVVLVQLRQRRTPQEPAEKPVVRAP